MGAIWSSHSKLDNDLLHHLERDQPKWLRKSNIFF
jgi:hypothetical protein